MSNAPNLPAHLGLCQCGDCFVEVLADAELCAPCKAAGCDIDGGECKADPVAVEVFRHQTSQAGLELARYGFQATHQGGGLVNYQRTLNGERVIVTGEGADGWGPGLLAEGVEVHVGEDSEPMPFSSLAAYLDTLPRP